MRFAQALRAADQRICHVPVEFVAAVGFDGVQFGAKQQVVEYERLLTLALKLFLLLVLRLDELFRLPDAIQIAPHIGLGLANVLVQVVLLFDWLVAFTRAVCSGACFLLTIFSGLRVGSIGFAIGIGCAVFIGANLSRAAGSCVE